MSTSRKKHSARKRLIAYGSIALILYGIYLYQPNRIDVFPRILPDPNPPIDPDSAFLFSPKAKVLVVTAHPDDSAFFIGGLLRQLQQSGAQVFQVLCTYGDKRFYLLEDWKANRRVRREEANQEHQAWGGKGIWFLGEWDGRLYATKEVVDKIRKIIDEVKPDYVVTFDGEYPPRMSHSDHRQAGLAATRAAKASGIPKWICHFQTAAANWTLDMGKNWDFQQDLLRIHASQFHDQRLEFIIDMVGSIQERAGQRIGAAMGEGFRCERIGKG